MVHSIRQFFSERLLRLLLLASSAFFLWYEPWLVLLSVGLLFGLRASAYATAVALVVAAVLFARYQLTPTTESWALSAMYLFILTLLLGIINVVVPVALKASMADMRRMVDMGFTRIVLHTGRFSIRRVAAGGRWLSRLYRSSTPWLQTRRVWTTVVLVTTLALFFMPFGWFEGGEGDYGGDSSRLYFLDPLAWLKERTLSAIGTAGYGFEAPLFSMIPFLVGLQTLKVLLGDTPSATLAVVNGLLLSGAFLSTFALIRDLHHEDERNTGSVQSAAYLGGLFFVFSPLLVFSWTRPLFRFHEIALYPLLLWLLLRFVQKKSYASLLGGVVLTGVFALNFGFHAAPSVFAAWPFLGALLFLYAIIHKRLKVFLRGLLVFLALFLGLHAWHLLPQIMAFTNTSSSFYQTTFTEAGKVGRGLNYFEGVRPMVRLTYNLARLPQYFLYTETVNSPELLRLIARYGVALLPIALLFPVILLLALVRSAADTTPTRRSMFLAVSVLFMVSLFFMTANMFGQWGPRFYASLFAIPGFAMFRSFYGVFSFIFLFLYALAMGLGLRYGFLFIRNSVVQIGIVIILAMPLVYGALPLIRGDIVNVAMNDTRGVSVAHRFSPDFMAALKWVKDLRIDAKFLTLPLTQYDSQVIGGESGGAYVGQSPLALLAGKSVFAGFTDFDAEDSVLFTQAFFLDRLKAFDIVTMNRLLSLMNVDFIFYNRSPEAYREAFIGWPYSQDIWSIFPTTADFARFAEHLGYRSVYERGPYVVYHYPDFFLPRLSTPRTIVKRENPHEFKDYLMTKQGYDIRTALYRLQTQDQVVASMPEGIKNPPTIEFRKISQVKYRVRVHGLQESVPLVFSNVFHPGWKLFPVPAFSPRCDGQHDMPTLAEGPGSITEEQLVSACADGSLSAAGPAYISQLFNGTIQNDNLPSGQPWETWGQEPLDGKYHLRVNEYANSWWLDVDHLKGQYPGIIKDSGKGLEAEFVLEFTPQRSFYAGSAISLLTVAGLLGYGGWKLVQFRRRNA